MFHPRWLLAVVLAAVTSVALLPARADASPGAQAFGQLRFVHASPNAPPVSVWIDGHRFITGLNFGESPRYYNQWAGARNIAFVPLGADLATALLRRTQEVPAGQAYTLMALGLLPGLTLFWMLDDRLGPPGPSARLSFVDASPNKPPLDLAVENGHVLFAGLQFGELTPYIDLPAGRANFELRWSGKQQVAAELPNVYLTPGGMYTIVTVGIAGGTPRLAALVLYDP